MVVVAFFVGVAEEAIVTDAAYGVEVMVVVEREGREVP